MCLWMCVTPCSLVGIYLRLSEKLVQFCHAVRRHITNDCNLQTGEQFCQSVYGPLVL